MSRAYELPMLDLGFDLADDIRFSYAHPDDGLLKRSFIKGVERFTGQPKLRQHYMAWTQDRRKGENIFEAGLRLLNIGLDCDVNKLQAAPRTGPLLVVANHPFGVADGLAIGAMMTRLRPDVKLICHSLLCQPVEATRYLLPIDFGPTAAARKRSAESRRAALNWLQQGHCLIVFPGGAVATRQEPRKGLSLEHPWHPFVGRLAASAGTKVLPVHFHGENSTLFHLASHTNYALRVALLFRETLRLVGKSVTASIGDVIDGEALSKDVSREVATTKLHAITMELDPQAKPTRLQNFKWPKRLATT